MDERRPISYQAVAPGTPVLSASGRRFGRVEHVLWIPELDVFDGIAVRTDRGLRFVDRDQVAEITTADVVCSLSDDEARDLPEPSGAPVLEVEFKTGPHDDGASLTARLGRLFGRPHWKPARPEGGGG